MTEKLIKHYQINITQSTKDRIGEIPPSFRLSNRMRAALETLLAEYQKKKKEVK